jgi:hypothetical protein
MFWIYTKQNLKKQKHKVFTQTVSTVAGNAEEWNWAKKQCGMQLAGTEAGASVTIDTVYLNKLQNP